MALLSEIQLIASCLQRSCKRRCNSQVFVFAFSFSLSIPFGDFLKPFHLSFEPTQRPLRNSPENQKHRLCRMNPPTKPATSVDDLPSEMISELFEYLPPKDLVACSMVNKRWYSIYAAFKLHWLVATDQQDYPRKWYNSNQPIATESVCRLEIFPRLTEKPLLSNLKHLVLSSRSVFKFDLNNLNRFTRLVHLEIDMGLGEWKVHLNLPRLKVLAFNLFNHDCSLSIDCPLLSTLLYIKEDDDVNLLEVKHPETVKVLDTDLFGAKLTPFKSVECLLTWEFEAISKATLLSLPALRELRYNRDIESFFDTQFDNGELITVDRMKRTLIEFLDEVKRLRGSDFRLIFSGFQLSNVNVDQIDFGVRVSERSEEERVSNEYVYMKNYQLIEPDALDFVRQVDYTRLLSSVTGEFPRHFTQKFTGIEEIHATAKVQDADHFLWFLKSLRSLRKLDLRKTELSQAFYDQLPASARSLAKLGLRGDCTNELQLNFNFIANLSGLSDIEIDQPVSVKSLPSLVRQLVKLEVGHFVVRFGGETFWGRKEKNSSELTICKGIELMFKTENPDEMVHFIEDLQND